METREVLEKSVSTTLTPEGKLEDEPGRVVAVTVRPAERSCSTTGVPRFPLP